MEQGPKSLHGWTQLTSLSLDTIGTWLLWNWSFTVWCISFSPCLSLCWFLTTPYPGIDLNMIYFHFDDLITSVVIYRVFFLPFPNPVIVITLSPAPAPSQRAGTRTFYHRSLDFLHHLFNASFNCIALPLVCSLPSVCLILLLFSHFGILLYYWSSLTYQG